MRYRVVTCNLCTKTFPRKVDLLAHIEACHKGSEVCHLCFSVFPPSAAAELGSHIRSTHLDLWDRRIRSRRHSWRCQQCKGVFYFARTFEKHLLEEARVCLPSVLITQEERLACEIEKVKPILLDAVLQEPVVAFEEELEELEVVFCEVFTDKMEKEDKKMEGVTTHIKEEAMLKIEEAKLSTPHISDSGPPPLVSRTDPPLHPHSAASAATNGVRVNMDNVTGGPMITQQSSGFSGIVNHDGTIHSWDQMGPSVLSTAPAFNPVPETLQVVSQPGNSQMFYTTPMLNTVHAGSAIATQVPYMNGPSTVSPLRSIEQMQPQITSQSSYDISLQQQVPLSVQQSHPQLQQGSQLQPSKDLNMAIIYQPRTASPQTGARMPIPSRGGLGRRPIRGPVINRGMRGQAFNPNPGKSAPMRARPQVSRSPRGRAMPIRGRFMAPRRRGMMMPMPLRAVPDPDVQIIGQKRAILPVQSTSPRGKAPPPPFNLGENVTLTSVNPAVESPQKTPEKPPSRMACMLADRGITVTPTAKDIGGGLKISSLGADPAFLREPGTQLNDSPVSIRSECGLPVVDTRDPGVMRMMSQHGITHGLSVAHIMPGEEGKSLVVPVVPLNAVAPTVRDVAEYFFHCGRLLELPRP
ncbi:unnamed protein product [Darwinula stevensoni]|uniref:C2H2-type domain-containing protein n=1 Tax=Darwinula stevensoni TaxID=69355 RepID=A0A7R8X9P5_9CRUS|nr:unnamed protein product [Darwinula stevensoni]CAG0891326.1 unnamed protein product [Darwinula stevensoni]